MQGKDWLRRQGYDKELEEVMEDDEIEEDYIDSGRACEMHYQRLAAVHVH